MTAGESQNQFEERHYTVAELAEMWKFSTEFVRQIVRGEPGVTEWVRQQPGRRRYRVIRVPQSVVERLYRRALTRAEEEDGLVLGGIRVMGQRACRGRRGQTESLPPRQSDAPLPTSRWHRDQRPT